MNVGQMRQELIKHFGTKTWEQKQSKMSDGQITAIYLRLKGKGEL